MTMSGKLDATNADGIAAQLLDAVQRCEGWVIVNLAGLTFISVAGVRALGAVTAWCSGHERVVHLAGPADP